MNILSAQMLISFIFYCTQICLPDLENGIKRSKLTQWEFIQVDS